MKNLLLFTFPLIFILLGCTKEPDLTLVSIGLNCSTSAVTLESGTIENIVGEQSNSISGDYYCTEQEKEITITSDVLSVDVFQSTNSGVGMVYSQDNLSNPLQLNDNYTFPITIHNLMSVEVERPTIVGVSDALNLVLQQMGEEHFPPELEFSESFFAFTDIQAKIKVESSAKTLLGGASIESFFELEGGYSGINYYVIKGQHTFTAFTDLDAEAIHENLDASSVPDGICPIIIKGATWGKLHIMRFSSEDLSINLKAGYKAAVDALLFSGESSLSITQELLLQNSKMQTLTLGGVDSYKISETIPALEGGVELPDFTVIGSSWGKNNPGVPLGFHYSYLDGTPYKSTKTTTYTEINCQLGSSLFMDNRTSSCGTDPGAAEECSVDLEGNQVLTGIGVRVSNGDIRYLQLQYRNLNFNGNLGARNTKICKTDDETPGFELLWEAPNNRVVTTLGLSESDDDVNVLKVTIAEPYNDNGKVRLRNFETLTIGDENYGVEADCDSITEQQIVTGVSMRANSSRINMIRLKLGIIEY